jgi:hypothetical protein
VTISWPTRAGTTTILEGVREYLAPNDRTPIGPEGTNISVYVALGGNRLDYGLADPAGASIRAGFYKIDKKKPFFQDIADDAVVTVTLSGITFNQPAKARRETFLQHLKFEGNNAVLGCAGDPGLLATWNTMDPEEDLAERLTPRNGRRGVLAANLDCSVSITNTDEATLSLTFRFPYGLLKHADDRWKRTAPGTFKEPVHFHIEFEAVPASAPDHRPIQRPPS